MLSAKAVVMVMFVGSCDHTKGEEITGLGSVRALILSMLMICKDGGSPRGQLMSRKCVVCLRDQPAFDFGLHHVLPSRVTCGWFLSLSEPVFSSAKWEEYGKAVKLIKWLACSRCQYLCTCLLSHLSKKEEMPLARRARL